MSQRAAIVLAAGAARRMGFAKQCYRLPGEPDSLIQHTVRAARSALCAPIVVVTGAHASSVRADLAHPDFARDPNLILAHNPAWDSGMASSLGAGLAALAHFDVLDVTLLLADQIHVGAQDILALQRARAERDALAAAASYDELLGAPACFAARALATLRDLAARDEGARAFLRSGSPDITAVPMPHAALDLDTPHDLARALRAPLPLLEPSS